VRALPSQFHQKVESYVNPIDPAAPVIDFDKSSGAKMYDKSTGKYIIDFATHYASLPLGYNHPGFNDPEYEKTLLRVSRIKVANLDILSDEWLSFMETFKRVVGPEGFPKYFFIEGGALGVENALKAAFDWKIHRNIRRGKGERGTEVIHFREAFHGRTGYTLSLTNTTDPNKTKYFPKFSWPRILNPKMRFPMEGENLEATLADEIAAKAELEKVIAEKSDDLAAMIIEPIQGEGGDNHFRLEFMQYLRSICDEHDIILIFDEVQTGMGMTGKPWAWQSIGVEPDIFAFAKKAQLGGMVVGKRILEEEKNVFNVPSRISSTWGGGLVDMVRCQRYLEIIEQEKLFQNAAAKGAEIVEKLHGIAERTELIHNVRGRGLFIAFDLVYPETRTSVVDTLYDNGLMLLVCGSQSIRFRPPLNVTTEVIDEALGILENTLTSTEVPISKSL
jgi:L-lysine 6-transaminase